MKLNKSECNLSDERYMKIFQRYLVTYFMDIDQAAKVFQDSEREVEIDFDYENQVDELPDSLRLFKINCGLLGRELQDLYNTRVKEIQKKHG